MHNVMITYNKESFDHFYVQLSYQNNTAIMYVCVKYFEFGWYKTTEKIKLIPYPFIAVQYSNLWSPNPFIHLKSEKVPT